VKRTNALQNQPIQSGPAERLPHALARRRGLLEFTIASLIVERMREETQEPVERLEVPVHGGRFERRLHPMIARNEGRIHAAHVRAPFSDDAFRSKSKAPQYLREEGANNTNECC